MTLTHFLIHAFGYLISQFLSPFFNKRKDEYGGSIENRARIVLDVLRGIREAVGEDLPVLIKMNSEDFVDGGFSVDDMLGVAVMLEMSGIDAIELSGGTPNSGPYFPVRKGKIDSQEKEVFYLQAAKRYKGRVGIPLILVGGIRSYPVAAKLVQQEIADYISLCRPLIREPDLVNRWKNGDRRKSTCLSDNKCFGPIMKGEGVYCAVERSEKTA